MIELGLVSVVMPCYNCSATVLDSIDSVLKQTYSGLELILVDDQSSDDTLSLLRRVADFDSRIKIIVHEVNAGVAVARNSAVAAASGDWIAFCDSDDTWVPNKLELQLAHMSQTGEKLSCSAYNIMSSNGIKMGVVFPPKKISYISMLYANRIGNLTGIYSSKDLGKFTFESIGHEDYLMWLNVVKQAGGFTSLQVPLGNYRLSAQSLSGDKLKSASWVWNIHRNRLGLNLFVSGWLFVCYAIGSILKRLIARLYR